MPTKVTSDTPSQTIAQSLWLPALILGGMALAAAALVLHQIHVDRLFYGQTNGTLTLGFCLVPTLPYLLMLRLIHKHGRTRTSRLILLGLCSALGLWALRSQYNQFTVSSILLQTLGVGILQLAVIILRWSRGAQRHAGLVAAALTLSFAINWAIAPLVHLPDAAPYYTNTTLPDDVRGQLNHFYQVWATPESRDAAQLDMSEQNPEWDLISRTFLAASLANVALQYPDERSRALETLDRVVDHSVSVDWREFLLPYGRGLKKFVQKPEASIMVDGEVSLMIGLRRLVEDSDDYVHRAEHKRLIDRCIRAIESNPLSLGESYPDECWLWCVPMALTSIKIYDVLEGTDHSELFARFGRHARESLIDPESGLFYSAVSLAGDVIHEPEGSTVWIGAWCLIPVLPELANDQYAIMKETLTGKLLFLRYGREWPVGKTGNWDIDAGFTPFGMGPASTGFSLVAAKEMDDRDFFRRTLCLLNLVGVPQTEGGRTRYLSSNLVGDATFLLAKTTGPAWAEIVRRDAEQKGVQP